MALDARLVRTRAALTAALLALLEQTAFDQITVRQITRTAGVGYATFFRHYPDKQALLNDLAAREIRDLLELAAPVLFASDSRAACLALCRFVDSHRTLWSTLLTGGAATTVRAELLVGAGRIAAARPGADDWLPADLKVVWAVGGVIDVLTWWLRQARPYGYDRIGEILDRLVVGPMTAGPVTRRP